LFSLFVKRCEERPAKGNKRYIKKIIQNETKPKQTKIK